MMFTDGSATSQNKHETVAERRDELDKLKMYQADRQAELSGLEVELAQFEQLYNEKVGTRLALLDELEAELAERAAALQPNNAGKVQQAVETRARATESAHSLGGETTTESNEKANSHKGKKSTEKRLYSSPETMPDTDTVPSLENDKPLLTLKSVWRQIAMFFHPDRVSDQDDKNLMTELMVEANSAYEQGDRECLEAMLKQGQEMATAAPGTLHLLHLSIAIDQVRRQVELLEAQIAVLEKQDIFRLKQRVDDAWKLGNDLLTGMMQQIDERIADTRQRMASNQ